jgi:hypothetical protein
VVPASLSASLTEPLAFLRTALADIHAVYSSPTVDPLAPRPALFLFSQVSAAIFLLEHATWSHTQPRGAASKVADAADLDAEVFMRWVLEGGMDGARRDLARARELGAQAQRFDGDSRVVYGPNLARPKL